MRPIDVTVLAVHPPRVAATRLRATQYADGFAQRGIALRQWSFFQEEELATWFGRSQLRRAVLVLRALLRLPRVVAAVRGSDVVLIQREALPLGPPLIELAAGRGRKLVWDVDDAIWEPFSSPTAGRVPRWVRAPRAKYERLCRRADEVWAGSAVLAEWCRKRNPATHVVPSVVAVPAERPSRGRSRAVGWIGSHSTGPFIEQLLPTIASLTDPPTVMIVGARPAIPEELDAEVLDWSLTAEATALERMRVGLYPIDRSHPLSDGKCGLKAILYMAHGVPPVVTPTPTNALIVRDGVDGLHADEPEQWRGAIQRVLDDEALWDRLSQSAYDRVRTDYSLAVWAPRLAARLRDLVRCGA